MRIWYIANIRFPTEKAHGIQIAKAAEALTQLGIEVELIVPSRRTHITAEPFSYYGIKHTYPVRKVGTLDFVFAGQLGFWIQSVTFAVAARMALRKHLNEIVFGRDELVLSVLSFCGVKNIFWESHDGTWNVFSRFIAKKAAGIVVVTEGLKDFYLEKGVSAEKIYYTPNGISLDDFAHPESKESARLRLGLPQEVQIALYIGRLDGWKGSDTLLEASRFLPESIKVAIIGGEGTQVAQLKKAYPNVFFLGFKPYSELPNNQAAADVLVVPNTAKNPISVRFTSPLKLIAHMASGRPIVASDLPSIRELVDEQSAVLVPADDPKSLALGIIEALERPEIAGRAHMRVQALDWSKRAEGIRTFISSHTP